MSFVVGSLSFHATQYNCCYLCQLVVSVAVQQSITVEHLDISFNDIGESGAQAIAAALQVGINGTVGGVADYSLTPSQTHLNWKECVAKQTRQSIYTKPLECCKSIQIWIDRVSAWQQGTTTTSTVAAYRCFHTVLLQLNSSLRSLILAGNKFGNKGGMYVASMLQVNVTLEHINVADTDLVGKYIFDAHTRCIVLMIYWNVWQGAESVIAFATVLNQNSSVTYLNINRPLIQSRQEETTVHIAKMLKVRNEPVCEV